jgi:hypothetical protein
MSTNKLENINSKNNKSFENSKIMKKFRKIEQVPVTTALSSFLMNLAVKQKKLQNEIENQRITIKNADKKLYFLSSKKYQNIESRYKKIKLGNKSFQIKLNGDIKKKIKIKPIDKSRSEIMMKFDEKFFNNNIFKTSISTQKIPIRINLEKLSSPKATTSINNSILSSKNNNSNNIYSESQPKNNTI